MSSLISDIPLKRERIYAARKLVRFQKPGRRKGTDGNMKFIREKIIFLYQKIKQACAAYKVTICAVELFTLYTVLEMLWEDLGLQYKLQAADFLFQGWMSMAFFLFILVSMLVESLFPCEKKQKGEKVKKILGFATGALFAAVFVWGIFAGDRAGEAELIFHFSGSVIEEWCRRFAIGYVLLLITAVFYVCHRKSDVGFIEYGLHTFINFTVATAVYFVLLIGINLVMGIVNLLFFHGNSSLNSYSTVLITGIYYGPACMMAMNHLNGEMKDYKGGILLKYVLSGITICALAVVYVYLLKILILWEMPSNEIYGIAAGLFCLGMPVWIIGYFYRDDTKYMRFVQKLPYGLAPVILVQAYAICVRIYYNGMTPDRYMGVVMVLFEIIVLFVWYFWKDRLERVLLIIGAGIIVSVFIPGINMYSVSNRWQQTFLETYYQKVVSGETLAQEEFERLEGAYQYLKKEAGKQELIEQFDIYEEDFAGSLAVSGIEEKNLTQKEYHSIHCCQMVGNLDVSGYSSFDMMNQDSEYSHFGGDRVLIDFSAFRLIKRGSKEAEALTVDLSDLMERCIAYEAEHPGAGKEEFSEAMKPYNRIVIDEDRILYLNHFEVNYRDGMEEGKEFFEIVSVNISGMLLSR